MGGGLSQFLWDVRYAARWNWANRGVAAVSLVALVVAITATASLFTVADALLFRPLPFPEADRLVFVGLPTPDRPVPQRVRPSEVDKLRATPMFRGVFAYAELGSIKVEGSAEIRVMAVTAEMTRVLGIEPIRGRAFVAEDDSVSSAPAALISHGLWVSRFASDSALLNQVATLGDKPFRIIGIMPPRFNFPSGASVWTIMPQLSNDIRGLVAVGRLATGNSGAQQFEVDGVTFRTLDLKEGLRPANTRSVPLLVIFVGAGMLLVVAWAHLGILRATQLIDRQRDLAVRLALGARLSTLSQLVFAESLIFVAIGALLSFLLLPAVVGQVTRLVSPTDTTGLTIVVDYRTAVFLAVATFVGAAMTSYGPIRLMTRIPVLSALRNAAVPSMQFGSWGRTAMLALQVMLVATSIYVSWALLHHVQRLDAADLGFDPEGLLAVDYRPPSSGGTTGAETFERLRKIPGVKAVAGGVRPLSPSMGRPELVLMTRVPRSPDQPRYNAQVVHISPGYFATIRASIVRGRDFDRGDPPLTAILSERLARSVRIDGDVLATGVYLGSGPAPIPVVGIAGDMFSAIASVEALPPLYLHVQTSATVIRADPESIPRIAGEVAKLIAAPGVSPDRIRVYRTQEALDTILEPERTRAAVVGLQSAAAMLMSVLAVYVTAISAFRQQLRHAAIRRALGGSAYQLLTWFAREIIVGAAVGSFFGVAFGSLALRWILPALEGPPLDFWASALTIATVLGCCVVALLRPAYSITQVNPATVLRSL